MARQKARGKSEEGLGDFTFLYTVWFYCVHLLTQNTFAQFIYNLSDPFIAPFSTLLISPVAGGGANVFDINVLIAIIVYALLGWLALWLVKFLYGR